MRNGSERTTYPTGRSADPVKLAVTSVPIAAAATSEAERREANVDKSADIGLKLIEPNLSGTAPKYAALEALLMPMRDYQVLSLPEEEWRVLEGCTRCLTWLWRARTQTRIDESMWSGGAQRWRSSRSQLRGSKLRGEASASSCSLSGVCRLTKPHAMHRQAERVRSQRLLMLSPGMVLTIREPK